MEKQKGRDGSGIQNTEVINKNRRQERGDRIKKPWNSEDKKIVFKYVFWNWRTGNTL